MPSTANDAVALFASEISGALLDVCCSQATSSKAASKTSGTKDFNIVIACLVSGAGCSSEEQPS